MKVKNLVDEKLCNFNDIKGSVDLLLSFDVNGNLNKIDGVLSLEMLQLFV